MPRGSQVERMSRTTRRPLVRRFHEGSYGQPRTHLAAFLVAYNFARGRKQLNGLTPNDYICKIWKSELEQFLLHPIPEMPGLTG